MLLQAALGAANGLHIFRCWDCGTTVHETKSPFAASQTGAFRCSRTGSRTVFVRCPYGVRTVFARCSRVVRTVFVRCSYGVRTVLGRLGLPSSHFI